MRIDGQWTLSEDGVLRPTIVGAVRGRDGVWHQMLFVIDTGADKTVICYESLTVLGLDVTPAEGYRLEGVGGQTAAGEVLTDLRLVRETGQVIVIHGPFSALPDPAALSVNLLGRDVLGRFAVIVDRPAEVATLLTGRHRYIVQET